MNIISLEKRRFKWSEKNFPEATAKSSLIKCREEIAEIEKDIKYGIKDPKEYADAIMCLFDSAKRNGISAKEVLIAYKEKIKINEGRTWKKNKDNTYSHVKFVKKK